MKVSVIILDFFKAGQVVDNVKSIQKQKCNFELEIIIVDNSLDKDNASVLNTLENVKNVTLIINKDNLWYTKWNNLWYSKASWDYIFVLNPDIYLKENNIFQELVDYLEKNKDVWIIGPKQENKDDTIPIVVRKFPNLFVQFFRRTFFGKLPILRWIVWDDESRYDDLDLIREVDWLQSSFFVVRKWLWDEVWGFDECYFIFMSDSEMCFQSWKNWMKVIYYPKVKVLADWKRASEWWLLDFFNKWVIRQHLKDSIKYFFNHLFESNPRKKFYLEKNKNLV